MSKFHLFQLVKNKIGKRFQKSFKEELFFGVAVILTVFLFGILVFEPTLKSLSLRDFSFLTATIKTKLPSQDLFVEPAKNFLRDSPKMSFIQKNSVVGVSPPVTITPQVLGSILGGVGGEMEEEQGIIEYVVESGDTLSSIAEKFEISLPTILWANNLSSKSVIKPGQKLIILPTSGALHLVKKGDTLSEIAETYKGKVDEIVAFNGFSNEGDIFIGDLIVIPGGKMPPKIPYAAPNPSSSSADFYMFPCEGRISQGLHYYNAIDIANKCGKPVVAVSGGVVQRTGWVKVGGNRITILHPESGVVTYYGHLSNIKVAPGQPVKRGDIVGYIGKTGYATGFHLHFDVRGAKNFLSKYPVGSFISW